MKIKTKHALMAILCAQSLWVFTSCTSWFGISEGTIVINRALSRAGTANCVIDPASGIQLANGILDLSVETGYDLALDVSNLLMASADETMSQETNFVNVVEANIYFTDGDSADAELGNNLASEDLPGFPGNILEALRPLGVPGSERYSPATGIINPNGSSVIFIPAITKQEVVDQILPNTGITGELIAPDDTKTIVAHVVLKAETGQGVVTFSNEFQFPIKLCNNCLVAPVACPLPGEEVVVNDNLDECVPLGQDQVVSSCGVPEDSEDDDE